MSQENRASKVSIVGICALLTFLLLGAPSTPVLAQSEPIPISIQNLAIHPDELSILQGDTVVWTNHDPVIHTLWVVRAHDQSTYTLSPPHSPQELVDPHLH